ncbi:Methyltransferase domain protein [Leptospira santarosai]|nr:Methyltransferase domain protein [Leptospira santarosai]
MIPVDSLFLKIEFRLGVRVNKEILEKARALTISLSSKAKED